MTQLAATVNATEELWTLDTLPATRYVAVEDETVEVRSSFPSQTFSLTGEATVPQIRVRRGVGGTTAASHNSGSALTAVYGLGGGGGGGTLSVDNLVDAPSDVTTIKAVGADVSVAGEATLSSVVVSASAPASSGPALVWLAEIDSSDMGFSGGLFPSYQLYVRNEADDAWLPASAGTARTDNASTDFTNPRTVGVWDAANGDWIGLVVAPLTPSAALRVVNINGSTAVAEVTGSAIELRWWDVGGPFSVILDDTGIKLTGLPTADPVVAGALWIDAAAGRVLKSSAG